MKQLRGKYYDGRQSAQTDATLTIGTDGRTELRDADANALIVVQPFAQLQISPRLADTPRFVTFSGGGTFETPDNDGVDAILAQFDRSHWSVWVHRLESHMRYIIPAVVLFILLGIAAVVYGVPAAAKLIANHLPQSVYQLAGQQTLQLLDRMLFTPSELAPETEKTLRDHLQPVLDDHPGLKLAVVFRRGGKLGPNAFALPNGVIVFTDEMVAIAKHNDEIVAVLAHEIGHVIHRHGMRRVVQDSLMSFALLAITGDASGVSELFLAMPVLLTELAYSREFEREADQYALAYLRQQHIPTSRFSDLMARIDPASEGDPEEDHEWTGYLSTHPSTRERMDAFSGEGLHR